MKHIKLFEAWKYIPFFKDGKWAYLRGCDTPIGKITSVYDDDYQIDGQWWCNKELLKQHRFDELIFTEIPTGNLRTNKFTPAKGEKPRINPDFKAPFENKKPIPKDVTKLVKSLVVSFLKRNKDVVSNAYDVNNGYCVEFAAELSDKLAAYKGDCFTCNTEDVVDDKTGKWDKEYLNKITSPIPKGKDLERITAGGHEWVYYNGKHYDAECPEGVTSFFDLPIFVKALERIT